MNQVRPSSPDNNENNELGQQQIAIAQQQSLEVTGDANCQDENLLQLIMRDSTGQNQNDDEAVPNELEEMENEIDSQIESDDFNDMRGAQQKEDINDLMINKQSFSANITNLRRSQHSNEDEANGHNGNFQQMFNQFAKVEDSKAQSNTLQVYRDENKKIKAQCKKLQEDLKSNSKHVDYLKNQLDM